MALSDYYENCGFNFFYSVGISEYRFSAIYELLTHDTSTQRNLFHALLRNYESKQTGLALKSAEHTSPNLAFVKTCGEFSIGLLRNSFIFSTPLIEKESGGDDEKYGEHIHTPEKIGRKSGAQKIKNRK